MKNYYGIDFEKKKAELLMCEAAKPIMSTVIKNADEAIKKTYAALKFSDYMLFSKTGDRKGFEKHYFERRNDLSYVSIAYWLTEDEKYKDPLENLIFHVCDEFSWCLPAHSLIWSDSSANQILHEVDLFQAETGRLLTDIYAMVGDKLHCLVRDRIEIEIKHRIIESFKYKEFHWLKPRCKTNWAAVCAGGVLVSLLAFGTDEEIGKILPSLYSAIEHFLEGFGDDGCCMEGCAYWNYGFGYFVMFARFILEYTNGEINYFKSEKVKNIATFMQKVRLGETRTVSFSDSLADFSFSPGLFSYLKALYPEAIKLPPLEHGTLVGNVYSVKELLWLDTDYQEECFDESLSYFENAEWYIKRYPKYSFAAKAGHNAEPHNHNDVGSFQVVTANEKMPLVDIGCAAYNAFTFNPDYRYKLVENASFGHNLPIINGKYQLHGADYAAKNVCATENSFSFDIEGAYEDGLVKRLRRSFELYDDKIVLCDTAEYSEKTKSITERLVSLTPPNIGDGYVDIESLRVLFDKTRFTASLTTDSFESHKGSEIITVYLIDFVPKEEKETKFKLEIII